MDAPMTPEERAEEAMGAIYDLAYDGDMETLDLEMGARFIRTAIRAAGEPLAAALRAMLWPGGVRPEGDDKSCHFPPPCEVCDAKAALAAWEAK
jgi:hypothetical protein